MGARLSLPAVAAVPPLLNAFPLSLTYRPARYVPVRATLAVDASMRHDDVSIEREAVRARAIELIQQSPNRSPLELFEQLKATLADAIVDDGREVDTTQLAADLVIHVLEAVNNRS